MDDQPPALLEAHAQPARAHSGLGIASFAMALITGFLMFVVIVVAGIVEMGTPGGMDEESPAAVLIGLLVIGVGMLVVVGLGLGIGGWVQRERKRTFAVLGVVLNALILAGTAALIVLGLLAE